MKDKLLTKIKETYPFYTNEAQQQYANKLLNISKPLRPNVVQWLNNEPLQEILIRNKYTINAVLEIRNSNDFIDAILCLNEYANDEANECLIWQVRL